MKGRMFGFLLVLLTLCALSGDAMQETFEAGPMPVSAGWPDGLAELVNSDARFAGTLGFADCWAYCAGDTKTLNGFLARYAQVPDARLQVVLHPGRLTIDMKRYDNTETINDADWGLLISEFYEGRTDAAAFEGYKTRTSVDVYLGGQIDLSALDVPSNIEVRSGGEIEAFVKAHRKRQGTGL